MTLTIFYCTFEIFASSIELIAGFADANDCDKTCFRWLLASGRHFLHQSVSRPSRKSDSGRTELQGRIRRNIPVQFLELWTMGRGDHRRPPSHIQQPTRVYAFFGKKRILEFTAREGIRKVHTRDFYSPGFFILINLMPEDRRVVTVLVLTSKGRGFNI